VKTKFELRHAVRCLASLGCCVACLAQAAPTGSLSLASVSGGAINISASRIDFALPQNPSGGAAGRGDFADGGATTIVYSGGVVTAATNPYGSIADIDVASASIVNFIQFYVVLAPPVPPGTGALQVNPAFDLTALLPGGPAQGALGNCAGVTAVGVSCSPLLSAGGGSPTVSPLVLTNHGTFTTVALGMALTAHDAVGNNALWAGGLTTRVTSVAGKRLTPDAIQTLLNNGGTISGTYSATFASPAPPMPIIP